MSGQRKGDTETERSWFRTDRLMQDGGKWFFVTREGKLEGPFNCRISAIHRLHTYTTIMSSDLYHANSESELVD